MKKVLIATLYNPDPVLLASNRLGPDKLILLLDKKRNEEQERSLKLIKESIGRVIEIVTERTEVYDIVSIAAKCVEIIDSQSKDDKIFVNITSGRKTKAMGLLFAAYARADRVRKIAYNPQEDKTSVIYLPKLSFKLTESEKMILEAIEKNEGKSLAEIAKKVKMSKAMLYRSVGELEDMDYISVEEGLKLTDAGKIARL